MRKKIIAGVLALTLVMGSVALPSEVFENVAEKTGITASAYEEDDEITSGDYKYGILDDGTVEIADYTGSAATVTIPSTLDGKKVTSIGYRAFWVCTSLTSITIPNSVTSIGDSVFEDCTSLASINVDSNNKNYSSWNGILFDKAKTNIICCPAGTKLTSITIPNSVTSIGKCTFCGCTSLASITIPNSVKSIGYDAFLGCESLASINVDSGNKEYSSVGGVLYNKECTEIVYCPQAIKSVTIPSSVTSIGDSAFKYCSNLTNITIPNSVTSIEYDAFTGCTSLKSITIPNSVKSIGYEAFGGCTSLKSIKIPDSVTSIGKMAFYGCNSLKSITIPNSVTSIEDSAFYNCESLKSITIPNRVTNIGWYAFYGCKSLKSVIIPSSVTSIESSAFRDCTSLKSVTIPKSVTNIEYHAFGYYYNEKSHKDVKIAGFTITCYYDSAAGVYARKNKIACKYINYIGNNKVKLSKSSYAYSGKANKPAVTIMSGKTKLKCGKDYTYTYKNNKAIGTASVVIKGKGKYDGTKAVTFKINPKKQTVKLTSYDNALKASWTKDKQATGYQVMYATKSSFKGSKTYTVNAKTLSKIIKGKNKTTYYAKVRTYKTVNGKTYCGAWSTAKAVKTK